MANILFEHNRIAYESVLRIFETENRAAVVHPTGTGKSFIGFQLCEDYADKKNIATDLFFPSEEHYAYDDSEDLSLEGLII